MLGLLAGSSGEYFSLKSQRQLKLYGQNVEVEAPVFYFGFRAIHVRKSVNTLLCSIPETKFDAPQTYWLLVGVYLSAGLTTDHFGA